MKKILLPILSILSILIAIMMSSSVLLLPKVQPETSASTLFSGVRAMKHVEGIAAEVHIIGSEAQFAARDYIVSQLEKIGLKQGFITYDQNNYVAIAAWLGL